MAHSDDLKKEAVRLRVEEFLGLQDIATLLKVSKSTASLWLKAFPLSKGVLLEKRKVKHLSDEQAQYQCPPYMMGMAAEYIFIAKMLLQGIECFTPVSGGSRVDVIVGNKLLRCQVKTLRSYGSSNKLLPLVKMGCNSKGNVKQHRYRGDEVDVMVGVDIDTFDVFVAPMKMISGYARSVGIATLTEMGFKNNYSLFHPVAET